MNDLEIFKKQFASAKSSVEISGFIITPEMEDLIFREAKLLVKKQEKTLNAFKTI